MGTGIFLGPPGQAVARNGGADDTVRFGLLHSEGRLPAGIVIVNFLATENVAGLLAVEAVHMEAEGVELRAQLRLPDERRPLVAHSPRERFHVPGGVDQLQYAR